MRMAKSSMPRRNRSNGVNVICKGSPSRMHRVLLISLGITMLLFVRQGDLYAPNLDFPFPFEYNLSRNASGKPESGGGNNHEKQDR